MDRGDVCDKKLSWMAYSFYVNEAAAIVLGIRHYSTGGSQCSTKLASLFRGSMMLHVCDEKLNWMAYSFYVNEAAAVVLGISHCSTGRSRCLMKVAAFIVLLGGQFLCNCTDTSDIQ